MAVMGMGGGGGWFYTGGIMGEWEVSLHGRQRGASPPYFMNEDPRLLPTSPFLNIVQPHPLTSLSPTTPTVLSAVLFEK